MKAILTAAWAAVLFVASLPASAALPEWDARTAKVGYSDLDLSRASGVSTLDHRVTGAIRDVCGGPAFEMNEKLQQQACERSAEANASRQIQNAVATAKQAPRTSTSGIAAGSTFDRTVSRSSQPRSIRQDWTARH